MPKLVEGLRGVYKKYPIPPPLVIADSVVTQKISGKGLREIKDNFDDLVENLQIEVYREYLRQEKKIGSLVIKKYFSEIVKKKKIKDPHDLINIVANHFEAFDRLFLSFTQSRRSRAGQTFEFIIVSLFRKMRYYFSYRPVINGEPDFLLPSEEYFRRFPSDCVIFTAKRTLRERWRQIVTEGTRGLGFYLATIDEGVSDNQLAEMKRNRIYLVTPKNLKRKNYPTVDNVISFSEFFSDHLDPAVKRWRRKKII